MKKILSLIIIGFCINAYADQDDANSLLSTDQSDTPHANSVATPETSKNTNSAPRLILVKPEPTHSSTKQSEAITSKKHVSKSVKKKTKHTTSKKKNAKSTTKAKKSVSKSQSHKHKTNKSTTKKRTTTAKSKKKAQ